MGGIADDCTNLITIRAFQDGKGREQSYYGNRSTSPTMSLVGMHTRIINTKADIPSWSRPGHSRPVSRVPFGLVPLSYESPKPRLSEDLLHQEKSNR